MLSAYYTIKTVVPTEKKTLVILIESPHKTRDAGIEELHTSPYKNQYCLR
jgi:hypothetical protein